MLADIIHRKFIILIHYLLPLEGMWTPAQKIYESRQEKA